jgi:hypothetical protein
MPQLDVKQTVEDLFLTEAQVLLDRWRNNAPSLPDESVPAQISSINSYLRLQLCAIETVNTEQARAGLIETADATEWLESFKYNVLPVLRETQFD